MTVKTKGLTMACIAGSSWGTYGLFSAMLVGCGMMSETVSMVASVFLFVLFLLLTPITEGWKGFRVPKNAIIFLLLDMAFSAAFTFSSVKAYAMLSVGVVSTIIYCNLFLLIICCRIIFKDPVNRFKIIATFVAVLGVMLVVNIFDTQGAGINAGGILYALVAMVSWTALVICEKLVMDRGVTPDASCCFEGLAGIIFIAVYASPSAIAVNLSEVWTVNGASLLLPLLAFGFISIMTAYYFYMHALNIIEATYVQICYTLDPAVACICGFLFLGQTLLPVQLAGIVIVLGTVIALQIAELRAAKNFINKSS